MTLIAVKELIERIENWAEMDAYYHPYSPYRKSNCIPIPELYDILTRMPTVYAEPVRHGHWKVWFENEEIRQVKCSECRMMFTLDKGIDGNYCPNCGAKMDEEEIECDSLMRIIC